MTRQAIGAAIRPAPAASHLAFIGEPAKVVLIGPNGLGKTMRAKNLTHQAVLHGHTARFTLASDLLHDLAAQDSSTGLARRLRRYTSPTVLAIDEVGYLSYDALDLRQMLNTVRTSGGLRLPTRVSSTR